MVIEENVRILITYGGSKFWLDASTKEELMLKYEKEVPKFIEILIELMTIDEKRRLLIEKLHKKTDENKEKV